MEDTVTVTRRLVEQGTANRPQLNPAGRIIQPSARQGHYYSQFYRKTGLQLTQQKQHTDSLKAFCETLVERVNSFTLPEHEKKNNPPYKLLYRCGRVGVVLHARPARFYGAIGARTYDDLAANG